MEVYGFARAGVAGEYAPSVTATHLTSDVTSTTTSYATLISSDVTIVTPGEVLKILFTAVANASGAAGATPLFRIKVDGTSYNAGGANITLAGGKASVERLLTVTDLVPGKHTITVEWSCAAGPSVSILASTSPNIYHASLILQRDRVTSDREMNGFPHGGWPMIYTCGTSYSEVSSASSTATTLSDTLISTTFASRYAQSALLLRFSACGVGQGIGAVGGSVKFQLVVDGVARCGTGDSTEVAGGVFNASFVCIVPVQAGNHTVVVNWAGGTAGATIDTGANACAHAELACEEVFSTDVNSISDMEGFVAQGFASRYLPRVGYTAQTADFTNGATDIALLSNLFYVTGDNSAVSVEFTGSLLASGGVEPIMRIVVDGTQIYGCTSTRTNGFTQSVNVAGLTNLPQGNHLIQIFFNGITSFTPATHPEYSHANMVVREIPAN